MCRRCSRRWPGVVSPPLVVVPVCVCANSAAAECDAWLDVELHETGTHNERCTWFTENGNGEEAVRAYQKWIESEPQNAEAHSNLAALLEKMGKKQVGSSLEVSWTIY